MMLLVAGPWRGGLARAGRAGFVGARLWAGRDSRLWSARAASAGR